VSDAWRADGASLELRHARDLRLVDRITGALHRSQTTAFFIWEVL